MSARQALLRMQSDGLIVLPPPTNSYNRAAKPPTFTAASDPQEPISGTRRDVGDLRLQLVMRRSEMLLWRELIARYHYLGYAPLTGARMHYLIYDGDRLLGAIGFGASAWKLAPRDRFIGWTPAQREQNLHRIVNNARFLLLPWVHVKYLASSVLALAARRMQQNWIERYNHQPVLLETFVDHRLYPAPAIRRPTVSMSATPKAVASSIAICAATNRSRPSSSIRLPRTSAPNSPRPELPPLPACPRRNGVYRRCTF